MDWYVRVRVYKYPILCQVTSILLVESVLRIDPLWSNLPNELKRIIWKYSVEPVKRIKLCKKGRCKCFYVVRGWFSLRHIDKISTIRSPKHIERNEIMAVLKACRLLSRYIYVSPVTSCVVFNTHYEAVEGMLHLNRYILNSNFEFLIVST